MESKKNSEEKSENSDAMRTLFTTRSRMLLKGDEGGAKFGGGVAENGDFRQGGHYPWMILALRVTGIVPLPLSDRPLSDS